MSPSATPGYWMNETSGVLRPAVEAYLNGQELTAAHIAALRAYLRQWVMATGWEANPYGGLDTLAELRRGIDDLNDRKSIDRWVNQAVDLGMDPF